VSSNEFFNDADAEDRLTEAPEEELPEQVIPPAPPAPEGVSFVFTQAQRRQVADLGYTKEQISDMKPAEAHAILRAGTRAEAKPAPPAFVPPEAPAEVPAAEEVPVQTVEAKDDGKKRTRKPNLKIKKGSVARFILDNGGLSNLAELKHLGLEKRFYKKDGKTNDQMRELLVGAKFHIDKGDITGGLAETDQYLVYKLLEQEAAADKLEAESSQADDIDDQISNLEPADQRFIKAHTPFGYDLYNAAVDYGQDPKQLSAAIIWRTKNLMGDGAKARDALDQAFEEDTRGELDLPPAEEGAAKAVQETFLSEMPAAKPKKEAKPKAEKVKKPSKAKAKKEAPAEPAPAEPAPEAKPEVKYTFKRGEKRKPQILPDISGETPLDRIKKLPRRVSRVRYLRGRPALEVPRLLISSAIS